MLRKCIELALLYGLSDFSVFFVSNKSATGWLLRKAGLKKSSSSDDENSGPSQPGGPAEGPGESPGIHEGVPDGPETIDGQNSSVETVDSGQGTSKNISQLLPPDSRSGTSKIVGVIAERPVQPPPPGQNF